MGRRKRRRRRDRRVNAYGPPARIPESVEVKRQELLKLIKQTPLVPETPSQPPVPSTPSETPVMTTEKRTILTADQRIKIAVWVTQHKPELVDFNLAQIHKQVTDELKISLQLKTLRKILKSAGITYKIQERLSRDHNISRARQKAQDESLDILFKHVLILHLIVNPNSPDTGIVEELKNPPHRSV